MIYMKNKRKTVTIIIWVLTALWMLSIFVLSHQSSVQSGQISNQVAQKVYENVDLTPQRFEDKNDNWLIIHYEILLRKTAHIFQYLILGILLTIAVSRHTEKRLTMLFLPLFSGAAYAASDELHQHFIPGRTGALKDVMVDLIGVVLGVGITYLIVNLARKRKNGKHNEEKTDS